MTKNEPSQLSFMTDEDGRTRYWVVLVGTLLYLWSLAIYSYILIAAPSFKALFSGFGAELPSLTALVLEYSWIAAILMIVSAFPVVALWRKRRVTGVNKARDFKHILVAFGASMVIGSISVYGFYLPIFEMGATVS